ncbi:MAG: hypothetical protein WCS69_16170 [Ignavibacteriaceae bacterium]|jgi:cell surface protein SprA
MKYLIIALSFFALTFLGCHKEDGDTLTPPVDDRISFEINYLQYAEDNYFIDQVYADTSAEFNMFNHFYGNPNPIVNPHYFVKRIEVYISVNQISQEYRSIPAIAYLNLPSRSVQSMYSDSVRNNNIVTHGEVELGRFRVLLYGEEYSYNCNTGTLTFNIPLNDNDIVAVAYQTENDQFSNDDDLIYGEFITELVNNSKIKGVLKLIKPQNLLPQNVSTWKLKMKNIYQIPPFHRKVSDLDLDIYLKKPDGSETNTIDNVRLLELFGFDKEEETGLPGHDGRFDRKPGITFNPEMAQIIFPVLEPFGNNIPSQLKNYKYQALYDSVKTYLSSPGTSFVIRGKYKAIY